MAEILQLRQTTPAPVKRQDVFFSAALTSNVDLYSGNILKFNKVILNVGDGYFPHLGAFIAPVAGYYRFYYSVHSGGAKHGYFALYLNDKPVVGTCSDGDNWENSSNVVIVKMEVDDSATIKSQRNPSHAWVHTSTNLVTTFTGQLISYDV